MEKDPRIQEIMSTLIQRGVAREYVVLENISSALESNYSNGSVPKTIELLMFFYDAINGKVVPITDNLAENKPKYHHILGAVNRNSVTCYLDTLIFSMFSRLESFEPMLLRKPNEDDDPNKENLAVILRLYVNLMRSGKLITTDITKVLLGAIVNAGWDESCFDSQQDCCDLFNFITDKLDMPLITLKLDIAHEGKEDKADDHKLINERLLLVSVPSNEEGSDQPILLEQCLEQYFANSIQVSRQIERRRTFSTDSKSISNRHDRKFSLCIQSPDLSISASFASPFSSDNVILGQEVVTEDDGDEMDKELLSKYQHYASLRTPELSSSPSSDRPPAYNTIFNTQSSPKPEKQPFNSPTSPTANSLWNRHMEITLPAWMFLQLVPFYTAATSTSTNSALPEPKATAEFATTRPVLGICLKRSEWSPQNQSTLNTRQVHVPRVIHFPSFVADDDYGSSVGFESHANYVLVLESAIFHRGSSTESGHFVALAKENNDIPYHEVPVDSAAADGDSDGSSVSSSHLHSRWILFDDLLPDDQKVQRVDYEQVFETEIPYILFYRLVTVEDFENESERHKDMGPTTEPSSTVPSVFTKANSTISSNSKSLYRFGTSLGGRKKHAKSLRRPIEDDDEGDTEQPSTCISRSPSPSPRRSLEEPSLYPKPAEDVMQIKFGKYRTSRLYKHKTVFGSRTADEYRDEKCIIS